MKAVQAAFVLALGVLASAKPATLGSAIDERLAERPSPQVYKPGNGVTYPVLLRQEQPVYTDGAQDARGSRASSCSRPWSKPEGTVDQVRVVRLARHGSWSR